MNEQEKKDFEEVVEEKPSFSERAIEFAKDHKSGLITTGISILSALAGFFVGRASSKRSGEEEKA